MGNSAPLTIIAHIQMEHLLMFSMGYPWVQGISPISIDVSNKSHMGPTMWFLWFLTLPIKRRKKKRAFPRMSWKHTKSARSLWNRGNFM
jgi:hypothetical protein